MSVLVRWARFDDFEVIRQYDEFMGDRRIDIQKGELLVADAGGQTAVGYCRTSLEQFFNWPMLSAVCVRGDHRRRGVASQLVRTAVSSGRYVRPYSSTEDGNAIMRMMFEEVGATHMGTLSGLNLDGQPERLYRLI